DVALWRSAARALGERSYADVQVRADWAPLQGHDGIVQMTIDVSRDGPALAECVEWFFHDAFLLCNIAVPGVFGGVITTSGSGYRVDDLTFDASLFEYAWVKGGRAIEALPLGDVVAWYDALSRPSSWGTRDVAQSAVEK